MSMDDRELSPFEHDEMRDLVLAGTERIRQTDSRRARLGVAMLLVGALVGSILTWALRPPSLLTAAPAPTTTVWSGWVAFAAGRGDNDIYVVKAGGLAHRLLGSDTDNVEHVCPAFSPDGSRLVAGQLTDVGSGGVDAALVITAVSADGEASDTTTLALDGLTNPPCALWSADGRWLAFGAETRGTGDQVWVVDTETDDIRMIPHTTATDLEWSPTGSELFIASNGITVYSTATDKSRLLSGTVGAEALAVSPDGRSLAVQQAVAGEWGPVDLLFMEADGSDQRRLVTGYRADIGIGPVWSPDGNRIAFQRLCDTYIDAFGMERSCVEEHEAVIVSVHGGDPLGPPWTQTPIAPPLTVGGPWFPYSVGWSPDSLTLLYVGWFSGGTGILAVPVDDAAPPVILEDTLGIDSRGVSWNVQS